MNTVNSAAYFPRPHACGAVAQVALVAAAAGMTAIVWLSMLGAGGPRPAYFQAAAAGKAFVTLPRVEVFASRNEATLVAGCAVDRSTHKPG